MRHPLTYSWIFALVLIAVPASSQAQETTLTGSFASTFTVVADNCGDEMGMTMERANVVISRQDQVLSIKLSKVPDMKGKVGRHGKLRAQSSGPTEAGIRGRYSLSGRISGQSLQAVLIAEYFKGDKPQCTQSWSVAGKR